MYIFRHVGRHPCLWCTIPADQMKRPRHERGKFPSRSLDSLNADYHQFQTTGKGDIRHAKKFNNVIGPVFFNIPISQVCVHVVTYMYTHHIHVILLLIATCKQQTHVDCNVHCVFCRSASLAYTLHWEFSTGSGHC